MTAKLLQQLDFGRLQKASANNIAYAVAQLDHVERLERGHATDIVAQVVFRMPEPDAVEAEIIVDNSELSTTRLPVDN
jgi:hypothetical protein